MASFNQTINVTMLDTIPLSLTDTIPLPLTTRVRVAATQYSNELMQIATHWNLTANAAFDQVVLQTSQRLGRNITEPINDLRGNQIITPGNPNIPAGSGIRLGAGASDQP